MALQDLGNDIVLGSSLGLEEDAVWADVAVVALEVEERLCARSLDFCRIGFVMDDGEEE